MNGKRMVTSVSLTPEAILDLESLVRSERRTKSEIIREALKQYNFELRWSRLRKIGSRIAVKMSIETDEDILRIMDR